MPVNAYLIVQGKLIGRGYQADIDTVRFLAYNPTPNRNKTTPLRLEGIDSLEVEYRAFNQPKDLCFELFAAWATEVGFGDFGANQLRNKITRTEFEPEVIAAIGGYDAYNRRVGFLFPPGVALTPGTYVTPENLPVSESFNWIAARAGWVYPAFYANTPPAVLGPLNDAVELARDESAGVWAHDVSYSFQFSPVELLSDSTIILPKLWRFLTDFYNSRENYTDLAAYALVSQIPVFTANEQTTLGALLTITDDVVGLPYDPLALLWGYFPPPGT